MHLERFYFKKIVETALVEDLGPGDLTSQNIFPSSHISKAMLIVKERTVLCGLPVAREVFAQLSPEIEFMPLRKDGDEVAPGTVVAEITGPTAFLLSGERTALNFLQRLSAVASLTHEFVTRVQSYSVQVVDTRKTTPGLRVLEKYAVRVGGGTNHRLGLFDAVMIKDNHIKAAGSISEAIKRVKGSIPFLTPVEVEVTSIEEALEAVHAGAEVVMLDNMAVSEMAKTVQAVNGRAIVEASGRVNLDNLEEIAALGVDIISVGALTHSAGSKDISMKIISES